MIKDFVPFLFSINRNPSQNEEGLMSQIIQKTIGFFSHLFRSDVWKPLIIMIILGFSHQVYALCGFLI